MAEQMTSETKETKRASGDGVPGMEGKAGAPGPRGPVGERGAQGGAGPVGDRGNTGERGSTGAMGQRGEAGSSGRDGTDGVPGNKGQMGEIGSPGAQGKIGEAGLPAARYCCVARQPRWPCMESVVEDEETVRNYADISEWRHPVMSEATAFDAQQGYFHCADAGHYDFDGSFAFSTEDFSTVPNTVSLTLMLLPGPTHNRSGEVTLHQVTSPVFQAPTLVHPRFPRHTVALRPGDRVGLRLSAASDLLLADIRHVENQLTIRYRCPLALPAVVSSPAPPSLSPSPPAAANDTDHNEEEDDDDDDDDETPEIDHQPEEHEREPAMSPIENQFQLL